jgi:sterol desaturase/sphingolipid hydroxylase (fatty acid hydroxylase superfamily)
MKIFFGQFIALFIFFVIFTSLEKLFALHKEQKTFRKGWQTDVIHFLLNRFLTDVGSFIVIIALAILLRWLINPNIQNFISSQADWIQFAEAVLIANLCGYLAHRLAHTIPFLWKFHAVHHSSVEMDWLASARLHPIDEIFSRAVIFVPLYALGFTKEVFGAYLAISLIHAIFNHSNVRFRFGFLRFLITTPQYHHWHHSNHLEARNKNFAGQFPVIDWIFGTYYLPKNEMPQIYGISEPMPKNYTAQLIFPFRKLKNYL